MAEAQRAVSERDALVIFSEQAQVDTQSQSVLSITLSLLTNALPACHLCILPSKAAVTEQVHLQSNA